MSLNRGSRSLVDVKLRRAPRTLIGRMRSADDGSDFGPRSVATGRVGSQVWGSSDPSDPSSDPKSAGRPGPCGALLSIDTTPGRRPQHRHRHESKEVRTMPVIGRRLVLLVVSLFISLPVSFTLLRRRTWVGLPAQSCFMGRRHHQVRVCG